MRTEICCLKELFCRAYIKASQIGGPLVAACEEYDLKTAYDEKNGEMLAVLSLKEDAAGE